MGVGVDRPDLPFEETSRRPRGLRKGIVDGLPGRPGWLPTQAPHRPVRAGLPHTVLQATGLLRDQENLSRPSGSWSQLCYPLKFRWDFVKVRWPCHLPLQRLRDPTPPFPPRGPSGWFPRFLGTIGVLRHPEPFPPRFVFLRLAVPRLRPLLRSPRVRTHSLWGPGPFDHPGPSRDLTAEVTGLSQVPGRTPLCTCPGLLPRGILWARPIRHRRCCLPFIPRRRLPDQ